MKRIGEVTASSEVTEAIEGNWVTYTGSSGATIKRPIRLTMNQFDELMNSTKSGNPADFITHLTGGEIEDFLVDEVLEILEAYITLVSEYNAPFKLMKAAEGEKEEELPKDGSASSGESSVNTEES